MNDLFVRIHDIQVENDFDIYISSGSTAGNHISGFTYYDTYTGITPTEIVISGLTYDTQYWIKLVDKVNDSYIIENIRTYSEAYYISNCNVVTPTPTPTITLTITPTITPTASSGATPTPTLTITPTYTPTVTPTYTPTPLVTPTPTPTPTQTITPTFTPTLTITPTLTATPLPLTQYCLWAIHSCSDTLHNDSVTYWDEWGNQIVQYSCHEDGIFSIYSSAPPMLSGMSIVDCSGAV